jgi:hypothetical protein
MTMTLLNIQDVAALPPYRNLSPRFRVVENPKLRIDTGYLLRGGEDQDSWSK